TLQLQTSRSRPSSLYAIDRSPPWFIDVNNQWVRVTSGQSLSPHATNRMSSSCHLPPFPSWLTGASPCLVPSRSAGFAATPARWQPPGQPPRERSRTPPLGSVGTP